MWYYNNKEITEEEIDNKYVGFVYVITNLSNNRKYIGQKMLKRKVKKQLVKRDKNGKVIKDKNGKSIKVRKTITESSDWLTYYGSNEHLNKEVKEIGKDNFRRDILFFCVSKAQMNYVETFLQFKYNVLFDETYYNGIVNCRISTSQLTKIDPSFMIEVNNIEIR